jgi:hypothetical protein
VRNKRYGFATKAISMAIFTNPDTEFRALSAYAVESGQPKETPVSALPYREYIV